MKLFYLLLSTSYNHVLCREGSDLHWMRREQKSKLGAGRSPPRLGGICTYSSTAQPQKGSVQSNLGQALNFPFWKGSRSVRKLWHCQRVFVARRLWGEVDIGEWIYNQLKIIINRLKSAKMILLIWKPLSNVYITLGPITIFYEDMKAAWGLRVPFMPTHLGSKIRGANCRSS